MRTKRLAPVTLGLVTLMATVGMLNVAPAQYEMDWWTVDGGGGTLSNDNYSLSGTAGQAEAGAALEGGSYTLIGGYWYGAGEESERFLLYLPLAMR